MRKSIKQITATAICLTLLSGQAVYATTLDNNGLGVSSAVAGVSVALDGYYEGVLSGGVSPTVEIALTAITDDEVARKASVLDDYSNLGIADVSGYLNVREEPATDGTIIGKMISKSACEIIEDTGEGWYKIQSGPVTGYAAAEFIATGEEAQTMAIEAAKLRVIVNADSLNVRSEPDLNASIASKAGNEERYEVLQDLGDWVEIQIDDKTGFVAGEFVTVKYALIEAVEFSPIDEKSVLRSTLCEDALQYLGNPYVWGGTSLTNGVDCSGFTMQIFKNYGVSLSHYSGAQANAGREISYSEARPGDLLFYSSSGGTIDHVAIYIGNGQIVHASSPSTGIIISRANSRSLVKVVNVIGD